MLYKPWNPFKTINSLRKVKNHFLSQQSPNNIVPKCVFELSYYKYWDTLLSWLLIVKDIFWWMFINWTNFDSFINSKSISLSLFTYQEKNTFRCFSFVIPSYVCWTLKLTAQWWKCQMTEFISELVASLLVFFQVK